MYSGKHSAFMIVWKKSQQTFQFCKLRDCPAHRDKPMAESLNQAYQTHSWWAACLQISHFMVSTNETFYF